MATTQPNLTIDQKNVLIRSLQDEVLKDTNKEWGKAETKKINDAVKNKNEIVDIDGQMRELRLKKDSILSSAPTTQQGQSAPVIPAPTPAPAPRPTPAPAPTSATRPAPVTPAIVVTPVKKTVGQRISGFFKDLGDSIHP